MGAPALSWRIVARVEEGELEQRYHGTRVRPEPEDDVLASEIAAYAYCAKAWHLEYVLGHRADAVADERRRAGTVEHEAHGARVQRLERIGQPLIRTGVILLALALVVTIAALLVGNG
jgi:hypothetical protein